ncbi:MAG: CBS domain-containing protein [Filomicrobium sp.]|jgi:signal-transduction protein with cAMP-binding, CBS, and nucleotidyltransferase domain
MSGTVIKVADVMTTELRKINGLASVREALDRMQASGTNSLVIERRHEGDEYGFVTVYDVAERVIGANRSVERTSVYEIMTKPALTLSAEMNIKYAIRLLARLGVRRALVTRGGDVVGFVSQRDMVMRYVDDGEER